MRTILEKRLVNILSYTWYMLLVRGVIAIGLSLFAILRPGISVRVMAVFFGLYVLADGIAGAITALAGRKQHSLWVALVLWAIVGIGVGVLVIMSPNVRSVVLMYIVATWAISTGVLEIVSAVRLRKEIDGEWRLVAAGVLSVAFGVFLLARPVAGALLFVYLIAGYTFLFGVLMVILAFRVHAVSNEYASTLGNRIESPHPTK